MLENKFFLLLVNFLWMAGLFGTLFTIVYTVQYRRKRWWNVGHSNNVPRTLVPLYLALTTLCAGLMLHAYMAESVISLGVALVWGVLALLFLIRFFLTVGLAVQLGWDAPLPAPEVVTGRQRFANWSMVALVLLLVNVALLGWWGNVQLNADAPAMLGDFQRTAPTANNGGVARLLTPFTGTNDSAETTGAESVDVMAPRLNLKSTADLRNTTAFSETAGSDPMRPSPTVAPPVAPPPVPAGDGVGITVVTLDPTAAAQLLTPPALSTTMATAVATTVATSISTGDPAGETAAADGLPPIVVVEATAAVTPTPPSATASGGDSSALPPPDPEITVVARVQSAPGANVRAAPTTDAPRLITLPNNSPLTIVGRTADSTWFAVRLPDATEGWIAAQLVAVDAAAAAVAPVVTP